MARALVSSLYLLALFAGGCSTATSHISIHAEYRKDIDLYNLVDCASEWRGYDDCGGDLSFRSAVFDSFSDGSEARTTAAGLADYATIRRAISDRFESRRVLPNEDPGFFAVRSGWVSDPFFQSLLVGDGLAESLALLEVVSTDAERPRLAEVYTYFSRRRFGFRAEPPNLARAAERVNAYFVSPGPERWIRFFRSLGKFFRANNGARPFEVFPVTWPSRRPLTYHFDPYTLLAFFAENGRIVTEPEWDGRFRADTIVIHEVSHMLSADQDPARKLELSVVFRSLCDLSGFGGDRHYFEEAMAVAIAQIVYADEVAGMRITEEGWLYHSEWIDRAARRMAPLVRDYFQHERAIDDEFMRVSARIFSELLMELRARATVPSAPSAARSEPHPPSPRE